MFCNDLKIFNWRDVLETVINRRKLTDAQANPSTQRKRYLSPIWQIMLNFIRQEQLYALLKIKEKKHILNQTHHINRRLTNKLTKPGTFILL